MSHLRKCKYQCKYAGGKSQVFMKAVYMGYSKHLIYDGKQGSDARLRS